MKQWSPDFVELSKIEEQLLVAKLDATRKSISHAGEKGRTLEQHVQSLLRAILPAEYGLSTGFVVWVSPNGVALSPQLDIIIYDAIRYGPLVKLETCDVLPLEAVYGYVEVKAVLRSAPKAATPPGDSIQSCIRANREVRKMDVRHFKIPLAGSPVGVMRHKQPWLSLRSYVFAFGHVSRKNGMSRLAQDLANGLKLAGTPAHLHGVFVAGGGFLYTRAVNAKAAQPDDFHHVRLTRKHALLAFKTSLLTALSTFTRPPEHWTPDLERYVDFPPEWEKFVPISPAETFSRK
jgi:hypothetical protein